MAFNTEPPAGTLDPQQPWYKGRLSDAHWDRFKAKLTGGRDAGGTSYFSMVEGGVSNADANRIISNMKKDPRGYPQMDQANPAALYEYQNWIVSEYLEEEPIKEEDKKIDEAVQKIADVLNNKEEVKPKSQIEADPWGEGTVPAKQYSVVPTTKLLPPAKEVQSEEKKPEAKKRGSSIAKSMTKTFARMETHFQKLTEMSEVSESNVSGITDAFRIQSDVLVKGFQETTALVTKVTSAVDLQASTMVRIAKGKKNLDQKNLDAQEAFAEEMQMEQQSASAGNSRVKSLNKTGSSGVGTTGVIGKALGSAVIAKLVGGKGLKLAAMGGKVPAKLGKTAITKAFGKQATGYLTQRLGREAVEAGLSRGLGKSLGKKVPFLGLGLGAFFAAQRAMKGDYLGAALEIASGAASTLPGLGTAGSVALDAALMARDVGAVPFEKGGLTQQSTFTGNKKRPGVTDLSPKLFEKLYEGEIKYEQKNKAKFANVYADAYEKYFNSANFPNVFESLLSNFVDWFKDWSSRIVNWARNAWDGITSAFTGQRTTQGALADVLPEGNPQITSRFGRRTVTWGSSDHKGLDIGVDRGSRVLALEAGTAKIYDNATWGSHGQAVVIDHGDNTSTVYGHVDPMVRDGAQVKQGDVIAKVKFWPRGAYGAQNDDNTHLHLERRINGVGFSGTAVDPEPWLRSRAPSGMSAPTGDYDIVIPLDHVPSRLVGKFPDKNDGRTFKQSRSPGADGREREAQDPAALKLKTKLEAGGLRVLILKPEDHRSYEDYDRVIRAYAAKGTRILPLHFDAIRGPGLGTGFLTRTRAGDAADAAFARPIQEVLRRFQKDNPELGDIKQDTDGNATVNAGAASPTALVELGVMVDWEKKYGKNFTTTAKFNELIQGIADAILKTTRPRSGRSNNSSSGRRRTRRRQGSTQGVRHLQSSSSTQTELLTANARLEEQIASNNVAVIRVNRTSTVVSPESSDSLEPEDDLFKQLQLTRMT